MTVIGEHLSIFFVGVAIMVLVCICVFLFFNFFGGFGDAWGFLRNPQVDLQAQDRAHRIGQKKEVQVFRFCTEVWISIFF